MLLAEIGDVEKRIVAIKKSIDNSNIDVLNNVGDLAKMIKNETETIYDNVNCQRQSVNYITVDINLLKKKLG